LYIAVEWCAEAGVVEMSRQTASGKTRNRDLIEPPIGMVLCN
jgi:hypothetical protein